MKEIMQAIANVQDAVGPLSKNAEGYGYQYLDHAKLVMSTRPSLRENGLVFTHRMGTTEGFGTPSLVTTLYHIPSGQFIEAETPLVESGVKGANKSQQYGADVTYKKRYQELSMLDIPFGDDADEKKFNKPSKRADKPATKPPAPSGSPEKALAAVKAAKTTEAVRDLHDGNKTAATDEGWYTDLRAACVKRGDELGA